MPDFKYFSDILTSVTAFQCWHLLIVLLSLRFWFFMWFIENWSFWVFYYKKWVLFKSCALPRLCVFLTLLQWVKESARWGWKSRLLITAAHVASTGISFTADQLKCSKSDSPPGLIIPSREWKGHINTAEWGVQVQAPHMAFWHQRVGILTIHQRHKSQLRSSSL